MYALKLEHFNKHQFHIIGSVAKFHKDDMRRVTQKFLGILPFCRKDGRQHLLIRMLINDDGFKKFFLACKVVVNTAQRKSRVVCDLAHGCGMIAILDEQFDGSIFDGNTGGLTFCWNIF